MEQNGVLPLFSVHRGGSMMMCVVVLPSSGFIVLCFYLFEFFFKMSGRFTGERFIVYSRSPLSEPYLECFSFRFDSDVGEIHRVVFL